MFGRLFAYQFEGAGGEPWAEPRRRPHGRHGGWGHGRPGLHHVLWHMGHHFFGHRGPFGRGGPLDDEGLPGVPGQGKRFFGRGDLKYALLGLLQERPMHGYEMMKALQERSHGLYTASPGSVYPTLQMLEDRGFVTVSEVEAKKVYSITEAGRAFLAESQRTEREPGHRGFRHLGEEDAAEIAGVWHDLREIGPLFGQAMRLAASDPEKRRRLRALLTQVRADLAALADEGRPPLL